MEAVPRLPMISFELKVSTEPVCFSNKLKGYIASFYNEDAESYSNEISYLESLRSMAVRPNIDVSGVQMLKKYYCQLHFLKSRFPMEENQACAVYFSWRDHYSKMTCSELDVDFEIMNVLYNIGAIHSKLGSSDSRVTPDGMKMACTHFQCAAWVFQTLRETYPQLINLSLSSEIIHFMHITCLAQAQECILEKSMLDNRKAAIIAKVAVQVFEYYKQGLNTLQNNGEDMLLELLGRTYKDWIKYLNFKISYHKAIALLYQGQQSEEQQKMGERVAFYHASSDQLQDACKKASNLSHQTEINEALAFTGDVVEGKKKAAKNENEFIYHEEVPDRDALPEVKGASLVKGIPFSINDTEVSGQDIFARLVPLEAHEASSLYSEQKAQMLRQLGEMIDNKDRALAEFMSSMKLEVLSQMQNASGFTQDLIDRAAAMSAKPNAIQDLVTSMSKLSSTYHDVESMLHEIDEILKEEEKSEELYQKEMGTRPPSIVATDLTREYNKYQEAHSKASDSNLNLHKAMTTHIANLKILALPLAQLKPQIPSIELPSKEVNEVAIVEIKNLLSKVDEMKNQRSSLWTQFRDGIKNDDITSLLVTRQPEVSLETLFQQELQKHQKQAALLEQNMMAQENILKALIDTYANFTPTRRYLQDVLSKRSNTLSALINSFDTYDDLLAKANKGLEFYNKLETNVSKLLQRIKSTAKVQDEEREQMLAKNNKKKIVTTTTSGGPKLKDYLESRKQDSLATDMSLYSKTVTGVASNLPPEQVWPPGVRPTPVGSEMNTDTLPSYSAEQTNYANYQGHLYYNASQVPPSNTSTTYSNSNYSYQPYAEKTVQDDLSSRMATLMSNHQPVETPSQQHVIPDQNYGYPSSSTPQQVHQNLYYQPNSSLPSHVPPATAYSVDNSLSSQGPQPPTMYSTDNSTPGMQTTNAYSAPYLYATNDYAYATGMHMPNTALYNQVSSESNSTIAPPVAMPSSYDQASFSYQTPTSVIQPNPVYVQPNASLYNQTLGPSYSEMSIAAPDKITSSVEVSNRYAQVQPQAYQIPTSNIESSNPLYNLNSASVYGESTVASLNTSTVDGAGSYAPTYQIPTNSIPATSTYIQPNNTYMQAPSLSTNLDSSQASTNYNQMPYQYESNYAPDALYNQNMYSNPTSYVGTQNLYQQYGGQPAATTLPPDNQLYAHQVTNPGYTYQPANPTVDYTNYANYAATGVNNPAGTATHPVSNTTNPNVSTVSTDLPQKVQKEASNIDLLSGLDFTVNQAPLIPQSKIENKQETTTTKPTEPAITNITQVLKVDDKLNESQNLNKNPEKKRLEKYSLKNPEVARQFLLELEKFEKFVDMLTTKTLNGPTTLDIKWKEMQDKQDIEQSRNSISVARCYPMKNRYPDILPFDQTKVKLISTKDDYINASYIKDVTPNAPAFIVTQAPLQSTFNDFWTMVWEQNIEVICCLIDDAEMDQDKYWPKDENGSISVGNLSISLQNSTVTEFWTASIICVNHLQERKSRLIRHFQFTAWPGSLFPSTAAVVNYVTEIMKDEKNLDGPLLVHCLAGIGRSGLFCLLIIAIIEVLINPKVLPDLQSIVTTMSISRKNIIRDREHFKFAYHAFLNYLKILKSSFIQSPQPVDTPVNTTTDNLIDEDPLNQLDPLWATRKN